MQFIKRRFFLKNILYLFSGFVAFFYFKKLKNENDYLYIFINKINLTKLRKKNINILLKKFNYFHHENFISDYRTSSFDSFEKFSIWLSKRIRKDYSENKLVFVENMFLSETEVSLLIIKYS